MASEIAFVQGIADDRGLTRDLSESELLDTAANIGKLKEVVDLVVGDLINQFTKLHGLEILTVSKTGEKDTIDGTVLVFCKTMGYSVSYAAKNATIARSWKRGDRVSGLGFAYYEAVQGCNGKDGRLTREQARQLLLEAQIGIRKPNGEWVKQHPVSWVKKKRMAMEGKTAAQVKITVQKAAEDVTTSIIPEVEKALLATGLTERKAKAQIKKIEGAIQKTVKRLEDEFFKAVREEAAAHIEKEREEYVREANAARAECKRYEQLFDGITRPIEEDELRFLIQFCHPDKNNGNEVKARKAYEMIERIGERLQFTKKAS